MKKKNASFDQNELMALHKAVDYRLRNDLQLADEDREALDNLEEKLGEVIDRGLLGENLLKTRKPKH